MTPAKLRLAMAAIGHRDPHVGKLCQELGITKATLYRHVGPDGTLREAERKLLEDKSTNK